MHRDTPERWRIIPDPIRAPNCLKSARSPAAIPAFTSPPPARRPAYQPVWVAREPPRGRQDATPPHPAAGPEHNPLLEHYKTTMSVSEIPRSAWRRQEGWEGWPAADTDRPASRRGKGETRERSREAKSWTGVAPLSSPSTPKDYKSQLDTCPDVPVSLRIIPVQGELPHPTRKTFLIHHRTGRAPRRA